MLLVALFMCRINEACVPTYLADDQIFSRNQKLMMNEMYSEIIGSLIS